MLAMEPMAPRIDKTSAKICIASLRNRFPTRAIHTPPFCSRRMTGNRLLNRAPSTKRQKLNCGRWTSTSSIVAQIVAYCKRIASIAGQYGEFVCFTSESDGVRCAQNIAHLAPIRASLVCSGFRKHNKCRAPRFPGALALFNQIFSPFLPCRQMHLPLYVCILFCRMRRLSQYDLFRHHRHVQYRPRPR